MEKLDPVQKYASELAKAIKKNNILMPGRSGWIIAIISKSRDDYTIREGIERLQKMLSSKGIKVPLPPKKVKEFLDYKRDYPIK